MSDPPAEKILTRLAEKNINIPFLCSDSVTDKTTTHFCVDHSDAGQVDQIITLLPYSAKNITTIRGIGLLTLFPHRNSLGLLGRIINTLARHDLAVYTCVTSISALAFTTDFNQLDCIVEKLLDVIELPQNHAPFRQEFQLKQPPR
ncbi:hypothetical protein [Desulforhopalus singaporensis]|uniref:hypothetical protein n=1 Tax=Desulforhopalus singaporensis TaxID=91360 RepID=UPI0011600986|nr:hypothetical protein [Desulforhopalus singaporensis]